MRREFDYLKWFYIIVIINLPTIWHRVMPLNSVSPVCEPSVADNNKVYNYIAWPLLFLNSPTWWLSAKMGTLKLFLSNNLSFSWSGNSLLFLWTWCEWQWIIGIFVFCVLSHQTTKTFNLPYHTRTLTLTKRERKKQ